MTAELEDRLRAHFEDVASTVRPEPSSVSLSVVGVGASTARRGVGSWVGAAACVLVVFGAVGLLAGRDRDGARSAHRGSVDGWDFGVTAVEPLDAAVRITATFSNSTDEVAVFRNDVSLLEPGAIPVDDPAAWVGCIGDARPSRVIADGATVSVTSRVDDVVDCGTDSIQIAPGSAVTLEVTVADIGAGEFQLWLTNVATAPFDLPAADRPRLAEECDTEDPGDVLAGVLERRLAGADDPGPCAGPIVAVLTAATPPCWGTCTGGRAAVSVELLDLDGAGTFAASVVWRTVDGDLEATAERFRLRRDAERWAVAEWTVVDTRTVLSSGAGHVRDFLESLANGRYDDAARMMGGVPVDGGALFLASGEGSTVDQLQRWCEGDGGRCTVPSATDVRPTIDGLGAVVVATFDTDDGPVRRVFTGTPDGGFGLVTGLPPRSFGRSASAGPLDEPCAADAVDTVGADLDGDGGVEQVALVRSGDLLEIRVCGATLDVPPVTGLTTQRWGQPNGEPVLAVSDLDDDGIDEITVGARSPRSQFQGDLYVLVGGELTTNIGVTVGDTVFDACADSFGPTPLTRYSVFARTERDGVGIVRWNAQVRRIGGSPGPVTSGVGRAEDWTVNPASCRFEPPLG